MIIHEDDSDDKYLRVTNSGRRPRRPELVTRTYCSLSMMIHSRATEDEYTNTAMQCTHTSNTCLSTQYEEAPCVLVLVDDSFARYSRQHAARY